MPDQDLVSTLRSLPPRPEPSNHDLLMKRMEFLGNLLEDLKLKQSITNELLLELVSQGNGKARPDFGSQVSPIRNKPFPRPIKRT